MIPQNLIQNLLYVDIETVGRFKDFEETKEKDPKLAELWEKRCKWLHKNVDPGESIETQDLWSNRSSLHPEFGKIVCVSFGVFSNGEERITSFYGDDETDILSKCNKVLENSRNKGYKIAGLNIKNFDIPYLGKRMLINGITPDPSIQTWNKKPWESGFMDLSDIFSFGAWGQTFSSLELIAHSLGIKSSKDKMEGSKVHYYFWEEKAYEEIKDYCEKDVVCTMQCFRAISS